MSAHTAQFGLAASPATVGQSRSTRPRASAKAQCAGRPPARRCRGSSVRVQAVPDIPFEEEGVCARLRTRCAVTRPGVDRHSQLVALLPRSRRLLRRTRPRDRPHGGSVQLRSCVAGRKRGQNSRCGFNLLPLAVSRAPCRLAPPSLLLLAHSSLTAHTLVWPSPQIVEGYPALAGSPVRSRLPPPQASVFTGRRTLRRSDAATPCNAHASRRRCSTV
jgi:hypothetical protein